MEEKLNSINTNVESGLSTNEVIKRQQANGKNELVSAKHESIIVKFFKQFLDPMVILLIIASILSLVLVLIGDHEGLTQTELVIEYVEPGIIMFIVILNSIFSTIQEAKAEKSIESLKKMSTPNARVIRDGKKMVIPTADLVVGDIILLEAGDQVPADAKLIKSFTLKVEEAALTGEAIPVEKNHLHVSAPNSALGDRKEYVYSTCNVVYGTASAVVTSIGMDTQVGKIADILNHEETTLTPLQKKIAKLSKMLGIAAVFVSIVTFLLAFFIGHTPDEYASIWSESLMTGISVAVAAIPEGLVAIVTVVLAIGVQRMVRQHAIIKKLPSVETLGNASIICSDKTGTLTQNKMTITNVWLDGQNSLEQDLTKPELNIILTYGSLCNNGVYENVDGIESLNGDPTETSILVAATKNKLNIDNINTSYKRLFELPFDSERKLMTTVNDINGETYVIVKGAPDQLISKCIEGDLKKAYQMNDMMAEKALRVLAVAYKKITEFNDSVKDDLENKLTLIGLLGMIDPPRMEVKEAVKVCEKAGIRPIMITGDHIKTAEAIATEIGIMKPGTLAINGTDLALMSEQELISNVEKYSVYARVNPEDKIKIVKAWQANSQVVAMTGDGVNDAPALKAADIGCAMGITGTDVSKSAADMILTDDNFATIVSAVNEGRGILDTIKRVIRFLLGTNIGEVVAVIFGVIIFQLSPFSAIQLLWINLITDSFPAIALGLNKPSKHLMNDLPTPKSNKIFDKKTWVEIVFHGFMFGCLSLVAYLLSALALTDFNFDTMYTALNPKNGHFMTNGILNGDIARYASLNAFVVLGISQSIHCLSLHSHKSIFLTKINDLKWVLSSSLLSLVLLVVITFIPGPLSEAFNMNVEPVKNAPWTLITSFTFSIIPTIIIEIQKLFRNHIINNDYKHYDINSDKIVKVVHWNKELPEVCYKPCHVDIDDDQKILVIEAWQKNGTNQKKEQV